MIRKAFVLSVDAGKEAEYERRHRPIWPELEAVLKAHGAHNYSIFLLPETRQLFGYVEIEEIKKEHPKDAKMRLAREIVALYHSTDAARDAEDFFIETFSKIFYYKR